MRPTLIRAASAAQARKPLIHFVGKRTGGHVEAHRPHPAAPQDIKDAFANLFKRFDSSSSSTSASVASSTGGASAKSESPNSKASGSRTYAEFWEAPEKLWRTVAMTEREMESVMTGGAA